MWLERVQKMPGAVKLWSFTPGMSCVARQPNSLILFWFKCLHSKLLFVTHPDCVQPIWNEIIKLGQENGCQLNSYFFLPQNCTSTPHHHWGVGMQLTTPTKRVTGDSIKKNISMFFLFFKSLKNAFFGRPVQIELSWWGISYRTIFWKIPISYRAQIIHLFQSHGMSIFTYWIFTYWEENQIVTSFCWLIKCDIGNLKGCKGR